MIDITPQAIAFHVGPIPVFWYGIAYAVGLAAAYVVLVQQARRFGQNPDIVGNGIIVIAIAALIGGRLYHVVDQFNACGPGEPCYSRDLLKIVLPPYSGLGVYGGLITGIIAFIALVRYYRVDPWVWADIVAPALFVMQAIGRWGNFFNQELYGPPTSLPWGIAIDCAHRVAAYACEAFPQATTHFHPLFLYESLSGAIGAAVLIWLSMHARERLRRGDLILIFFIWYPVVRFLLETLRTGNWRLGGVPTAQIFSIAFALGAFLVLLYRHRRARDDEAPDDEANDPFADTSGGREGSDPPSAMEPGEGSA